MESDYGLGRSRGERDGRWNLDVISDGTVESLVTTYPNRNAAVVHDDLSCRIALPGRLRNGGWLVGRNPLPSVKHEGH